MLQLPPLSLYVHIPWCIRKCPYCDFNSHRADSPLPEADYIDALIRDLQWEQQYAQGRKLCSVFFGGGTPSLFSAAGIARILAAADQLIGFTAAPEITLEANPGASEQARFEGFRAAGVNRLSIGIQSFQTLSLQALGRVHSAAEAVQAVEKARKAGFDNINLDLMHGLPDQTPEMALSDLRQAIALGPSHISWYQLTIEPNTLFYRAPPALPEEDMLAAIQEQGFQLLTQQEYQQYEVSAFAQPGRQALHNRNYWEFGDYIGVGAGAHGKITRPDNNSILRRQKIRQPDGYLTNTTDFLARQVSVNDDALITEFFINALRLREGVPTKYFLQRTGVNPRDIQHAWLRLADDGLVESFGEQLKTTQKGFEFLNETLIRLEDYHADSSRKILPAGYRHSG